MESGLPQQDSQFGFTCTRLSKDWMTCRGWDVRGNMGLEQFQVSEVDLYLLSLASDDIMGTEPNGQPDRFCGILLGRGDHDSISFSRTAQEPDRYHPCAL